MTERRDRLAALIALSRVKHDDRERNAYRCPLCHAWHLTSQGTRRPRGAPLGATDHDTEPAPDNVIPRAWNHWTWGGAEEKPFPLPSNWKSSIERMHLAGASMDDLDYATEAAIFAGVVWRVLADRQEIAQAIVQDDT